jgi:hypothetical protein
MSSGEPSERQNQPRVPGSSEGDSFVAVHHRLVNINENTSRELGSTKPVSQQVAERTHQKAAAEMVQCKTGAKYQAGTSGQ